MKSLTRSTVAALTVALATGCAALPHREPAGAFSLESRTTIAPQAFYRSLGPGAGHLLAYDLREVERSVYREASPGGVELAMERLTFGSAPEALGFFNAARLREQLSRAKRWPYGYLSDGLFVSVRGAALLRVTAPAARGDAALSLAMLSGARPEQGDMPPQVGALLKLGVDPWDISWEVETVLGAPALAPAVTAPIPGGPVGSKVAFLAKNSPAEADAALLAFLDGRAGGKRRGVSFTIGVGDLAASVWDAERGWICVARRGNVIAGTAGLPAADDGWPSISRLLATLQ